MVRAREKLGSAQLEALEAARLEVAAAKRLMKKINKRPTASGENSESDHETARGSAEPPPPGLAHRGPGAAVRSGLNQGKPWGSAGWLISRIEEHGEWKGMGAICGHHHNPGDDRRCQKSVTFGSSGLDEKTLVLRLKRWLVAGPSMGMGSPHTYDKG